VKKYINCNTHGVYGTLVELSNLINVTNVIKINHLSIIIYECCVMFDDVAIWK
jgi:hypothetical protein